MGVRSTVDSNGITWFCIGINPEQWQVGPLSVGRRNGKLFPIAGRDQQLAAYQEAIREEMGDGFEPLTGKQRIRFYFWRTTEGYSTASGRSHRRHQADATNLQKALEDALQGILYENDRDTWDIRSVIVDQGPDVIGKVLFSVEPLRAWTSDIPQECIKLITETDLDIMAPQYSDNSWPPRA